MAKSLNKSRMRDSRLVLILALLAAFFTKAFIPSDGEAHEVMEFIGYVLVAFCALGRLYSTAFLGGHKNQTLITYGAFSIVRNPLYFFSFVGITGIALISAHIVIIAVLPIVFFVMYHYLIKREEVFLQEQFGEAYAQYKKDVPRFFPNFKLYQAPDTIEAVPKYLTKALKDAIWWFAAFPIFELAEKLQKLGYIKTLFMLP